MPRIGLHPRFWITSPACSVGVRTSFHAHSVVPIRAWYDDLMTTNLDVLYRYELHPTEAAMIALGKARGVYGIRRIAVDEQQKTMRVEFDFTRLNRAVVAELLRSAGIDIVEEIALAPPPTPKEEPAPALPPK